MLVQEIKEKYEEVLKNRNHVTFIAKTNKKGKVVSFAEDNNSSNDKKMLNATVYDIKNRDYNYEKIKGLKQFIDKQSNDVQNLFIIFVGE